MNKYFTIAIAAVVFFLLCTRTNAQWSRKDVEWMPEGLTSKNYRLIRGSRHQTDIKIGAVTGSKPAMDASVVNINGKRVLRITLSNHFDYEHSWMLKSEAGNASLIKHEQGHFDITEIYTRRMFQQFKNFKFTNDFKKEIYAIMQAENNELKQQQMIYERETAHGTNPAGQAKWNQKIAGELAALPSYKDEAVEQEIPGN